RLVETELPTAPAPADGASAVAMDNSLKERAMTFLQNLTDTTRRGVGRARWPNAPERFGR
ncbi:MAG: hypothetical protein J5I99_06755, partial [Verrucomicrobia bacterium]|nr:hypothetical protein [Verrucomicrobiota bacterium]